MALVRFLKDYAANEAENDAPRADWDIQHKVGPVGLWYAGQQADLHEDEIGVLQEKGVVEVVARDGAGQPAISRPLWTEVEVGAETGGEEQATVEDRPVVKKVASAQDEPVKATRKFETAPKEKKSATLNPKKSAAKSEAAK